MPILEKLGVNLTDLIDSRRGLCYQSTFARVVSIFSILPRKHEGSLGAAASLKDKTLLV